VLKVNNVPDLRGVDLERSVDAGEGRMRKRRKVESDTDDVDMSGVDKDRTGEEDESEEGDEEEGGPETDEQDDVITTLGLLVPNIELNTGCSPAFIPGAAPSSLAQTLTARLQSLLSSTRLIRTKDLQIWYTPPPQDAPADPEDPDSIEPARPSVKAFWTLYIDTLVISLDSGSNSVFDTIWLAVLAALKHTRLPYAYWDADLECVIADEDARKAQTLVLQGNRRLPIATSFGVFNAAYGTGTLGIGRKNVNGAEEKSRGQSRWILADTDAFEEDLCLETVTVVTGEDNEIVRLEKNGGGTVGREAMREIVNLAANRAEQIRQVLDSLQG
jgi:exosome complex component RRP43